MFSTLQVLTMSFKLILNVFNSTDSFRRSHVLKRKLNGEPYIRRLYIDASVFTSESYRLYEEPHLYTKHIMQERVSEGDVNTQ
jgi:hypothetical protein